MGLGISQTDGPTLREADGRIAAIIVRYARKTKAPIETIFSNVSNDRSVTRENVSRGKTHDEPPVVSVGVEESSETVRIAKRSSRQHNTKQNNTEKSLDTVNEFRSYAVFVET